MKKIFAIPAVLALLLMCNCASLLNQLCKPTTEQQNAADLGKGLAQSFLDVGAAAVNAPWAKALRDNAIPVFDKVVAGACALTSEWNTAVAALEQAQAANPGTISAKMSMGTKEVQVDAATLVIQKLKQVRWKR